MAALQKHREKLIQTAVSLFRCKGYAATGLAEILSESGAPKGSLYHYFPGGKVAMAEEALRLAAGHLGNALRKFVGENTDPGEMIMAYGRGLATLLERSDFRDGCPVGTLMVEMAPELECLATLGAEAFASWSAIVAGMLRKSGIPDSRASQLADFTVSSFEGALLVARARKSIEPITRAAEELRRIYTDAVRHSRQPESLFAEERHSHA